MNRFIDLIRTRQLYFARFDQFSDEWEGVLPPETKSLAKDGFTNLPRNPGDNLTDWETYVLRVNRTNKLCAYANCWYQSDHESEAMWQLYGHEGVAVKSTFGRLCDSVAMETEDVHIGEVNYIDFRYDQPSTYGNTLSVAFAKRNQFEHEREIRAVVVHMPPEFTCISPQYEGLLQSHPTYRRVAIDLDTLVDQILVAPGSSATFTEDVQAILASAGLNKQANTSSIDDRPKLL